MLRSLYQPLRAALSVSFVGLLSAVPPNHALAMEAPVTVPVQKTEEPCIVPTGGYRTIAQIRADPVFGGAPVHRFPENMPLGPHGFGLSGRLAMLNAHKHWPRSYGVVASFPPRLPADLTRPS